jgi:hypothetical protein
MSLYGERPASSLTISDALSTGFKLLTQPMFIVPVLVLGAIVNIIVTLVLVPLFVGVVPGGTSTDLTGPQVGAIVGGVVVGILAGIIGGVLLNLYGQIWAAVASVKAAPTFNETLTLIGERWMGVIGTGLVMAGISIGMFLVVALVSAALGAIAGAVGFLVFLAGVVVMAWVGARLSMAGWLAADGHNVTDSLYGSWAITKGNLLRIIGWGLAYGIIFAIVGAILGAILGLIPIVGAAVAQAITAALGFGAGVTLYRRTQAASGTPASPEPAPAPAA